MCVCNICDITLHQCKIQVKKSIEFSHDIFYDFKVFFFFLPSDLRECPLRDFMKNPQLPV